MPRIKIDTKSDLYPPIEIEISGEVFTLPPIDHAFLTRVDEFDRKVMTGSPDAPYERLEFMLGVKSPSPIVRKLDVRTLKKITDAFTKAIYFPEDESEKKSKIGGQKLKKSLPSSRAKSRTKN